MTSFKTPLWVTGWGMAHLSPASCHLVKFPVLEWQWLCWFTAQKGSGAAYGKQTFIIMANLQVPAEPEVAVAAKQALPLAGLAWMILHSIVRDYNAYLFYMCAHVNTPSPSGFSVSGWDTFKKQKEHACVCSHIMFVLPLLKESHLSAHMGPTHQL